MPNKSNQDENLLDASDSKLILRILEQSSLAQIDEEEAGGSGSKKERYFWQYNVQAKGPKGQVIQFGQIDPETDNEIGLVQTGCKICVDEYVIAETLP